MGIYGEAGTGKTFTSTRFAIGLHQFIKSELPVFFFDTETGSDFVRDRFAAEKINLQVAKTRAFSDLLAGLDDAPPRAIVLIDSLTHFWNDLIDSYLKKKQKTRLILPDWQPLKATWREFSDRFINSQLHIIWAARSADKWDEVESEDGAKELRKVGTKARTETEMGYEPSLLIEMELVRLSARIGGAVTHRAWVLKDRFDVINAQSFDNPGFEAILPHVRLLNIGGEHLAIETDHDSQDLFDDPNIGEKRALNKEILCEKIANEIKKLYPGQTEKDKAARTALFEEVFGTNSWTEISTLFKNDKLEAGLNVLRAKVAGEPTPLVAPEAETLPGDGKGKPKTKGAHA
jgi:hypothetical protein